MRKWENEGIWKLVN